jgi:MucR family transcriptional regulator, transcriptional regulator of exopolysaccharide biosynthesis
LLNDTESIKPKEMIAMSSEVLKLTTEIIISHVSMTELSPEQLVDEIKAVYNVLTSLDGGVILEEAAPGESEAAGMVKQSPIPLKDIVKAKYVVCLECGKKLKTLKTHLRKTHGLMPKEYFQRFGLDPKKFPLVCKDYSEARSKMAKDRGLGALRGKRKAAKTA